MPLQVNFAQYVENKAKAAIQIQKIGTKAVVFIRSFNPENGAENDPQVSAVNPLELQALKKSLLDQVAGLDAMLADMAALGVAVEAPAEKPVG